MVMIYKSDCKSTGASASEVSNVAFKYESSKNKEQICLETDKAIAPLIEMTEKINWK